MRGVPVDAALQERRTTSDHVADALRSAILGGEFADGEELNQVELARHFGVSRVPVREALRQLQAEGLVSAEAHRRAVVVGFSQERIEEIFEIRALIEGHTLERSAPAIDKEALARLRDLCDAMDATTDQASWLELNHAFHRALLEPSGQRTAIGLVAQLSGQVGRYIRRAGVNSRLTDASSEHRLILDALEANDVPRARAALEAHINQTLQGIEAQLEDPVSLELEDLTAP